MIFVSLGSGSKGNVAVVENKGRSLLIDAGLYHRNIADRIKRSGLNMISVSAVLLTHEHSDHVRGLDVFLKRKPVPVHLSRGTYDGLSAVKKEMIGKYAEIFDTGDVLNINGLQIKTFPVSHDAGEPVGFAVSGKGRKLGYATDVGKVTGELIENLAGADGIVLESNHDIDMLWDGPYPEILKQRIAGPFGHLSNPEALRVIESVATKNLKWVVFAHLSQENNRPDIVLRDTVSKIRNNNGAAVEIIIADQDVPTAALSI
ncbi:MBL fold metallo-hydrolase [candidate division KSB1 bacterium]